MFHFYTPWKRQKTFGFRMSSGVIEMEHLAKNGLNFQMKIRNQILVWKENTAWKVSKYGVFLFRIFLYSNWIRRFTP